MPYLRSVVLKGGKYQHRSSSSVIAQNFTKNFYICIDVKFGLTTYLQQTFFWGAVDLALGRGCCCVQRNLDQVWDFLAAVFII